MGQLSGQEGQKWDASSGLRTHKPSYSLLGTYVWCTGHTDMLWPFHLESRGRPVESEIQSFAFAMEQKHPKNMEEKGDPQRDCWPGCLSWAPLSFPALRPNMLTAEARSSPSEAPFPQSRLQASDDSRVLTCAESMTATIIFSSSPLRKVSSGNWRERGELGQGCRAEPLLPPQGGWVSQTGPSGNP